MRKLPGTMTMEERKVILEIMQGCVNIWPVMNYIYQHPFFYKITQYMIENNIKGMKIIDVLQNDFCDNIDDFIRWTLKTKTEQRYKL